MTALLRHFAHFRIEADFVWPNSGIVARRGIFKLFRLLASLGLATVLFGCAETATPVPKKIQVVGDRSYAPYEFNESGASKGLLVDLWSKWSERTGVAVDYVLDDWQVSQEKVKTGRADAVGGIMRDPDREKDYDFIRQIMSLDEYVYVRSSKFPSVNFTDFHQLTPYVVGIVQEDEAERMYRRYVTDRTLNIKLYGSYSDLIQHAVAGDIDIFLMEQPVARYWLDNFDKERSFQRSKDPLFSQMQYIAVRKGNRALANLINEGFDRLSAQDVISIRDKWEGYRINITEDAFAVKLERFFYHYFFVMVVGLYVAGMLALWLLCLIFCPRILLLINKALREIEIPVIEIGPVKGLSGTAIRWLILVAPFEFLPRVLDDWIRSKERQIATSFQSNLTVQSKQLFYASNMTIDGQEVTDANSRDRETRIKELSSKIFQQNRAILVVGEGGIGKTSLACWFGQQALQANIRQSSPQSGPAVFPHPVLPILFEADLSEAATVKAETSKTEVAKTEAVKTETSKTDTVKAATRTKLSDLLGFAISEPLLERLIATNRVFAIVDGYSERDTTTQKKLSTLEPAMRFRRLLITSRSPDSTMGFPVAIMRPHRLSGPVIANFLATYVDGSKIGDKAFYDACGQISVLIREANVTPLFVSLYGYMLGQSDSPQLLGSAPQNVPDLVEQYLATLNNRVQADKRDFSDVLAAAKVASWACLQPNYLPGELSRNNLIHYSDQAKRPLTPDMIDYLHRKLGFLVNPRGDLFKISEDPLAEYFAAMLVLDSLTTLADVTPRDRALLWTGLKRFMLGSASDLQRVPTGFIAALADVVRTKKYALDGRRALQIRSWETLCAKAMTAAGGFGGRPVPPRT